MYLKFGEWTEGGRIGALTRNREFFDVKAADYFIKTLLGKEIPQGVFISLSEVKGIIAKDAMTEKDFRQIEIALTNIMEMM